MIDFKTIIKDFPILNRIINENKLIYFDNAATSQKPKVVIDALSDFYSNNNANIHRGVHTLSMEATYLYDEAKDKIAEFINAPNSNSIIFTRGTTESLNLIADSWGQSNLKESDTIVITELEHHSNIVPWQELIKKTKSKLRYIPINTDGTLNLANINNIITKNTKLISMTHVSNGIGTINNIKKIIKIAKSVGATTVIDAAQSVPHMPIDVSDLDCDFLTFSGHKMLAPTGIGVLYGKKELLEAMPPYQKGGDMILEVTYDKATWNEIPFKFEAGTPNIAGAIGLSAATNYLMKIGMQNIRDHEIEITKYAYNNLMNIDGIEILGPENIDIRAGLISFNIPNIHPHDLGTFLDSKGIAIRTGHHCAMPLIKKLGRHSSARASFYIYNTNHEVDKFTAEINNSIKYFNNV
ncbi:MAG TPA: cysteine desulfurase [Dehalococcoidia bacterium]|nr:cysteine desulfurase [Dehalococcoidia bacterium]